MQVIPMSQKLVCQHESSSQNTALPGNVVGAAASSYDGATQCTYQLPPKSWETIFCNRFWYLPECNSEARGLDPSVPSFYCRDFEVRMTNEVVGRALYSREYIPQGSYIMVEKAPHVIYFDPHASDQIWNLQEIYHDGKYRIIDYIRAYANDFVVSILLEGLYIL